jgi:hypothetical protein
MTSGDADAVTPLHSDTDASIDDSSDVCVGRHQGASIGEETPEPRWWWRGSLRRSETWRRGLVAAVIVAVGAWLALLQSMGSIVSTALASGLSWSSLLDAAAAHGDQIAWRGLCTLVVTAGWVVYLMLPVRDDD